MTLAGSEHSDTSASAATLALVLGPLALLALAPFALRSRGVPSWSMVVGAGLAFAIGAFSLKLIADARQRERVARADRRGRASPARWRSSG